MLLRIIARCFRIGQHRRAVIRISARIDLGKASAQVHIRKLLQRKFAHDEVAVGALRKELFIGAICGSAVVHGIRIGIGERTCGNAATIVNTVFRVCLPLALAARAEAALDAHIEAHRNAVGQLNRDNAARFILQFIYLAGRFAV